MYCVSCAVAFLIFTEVLYAQLNWSKRLFKEVIYLSSKKFSPSSVTRVTPISPIKRKKNLNFPSRSFLSHCCFCCCSACWRSWEAWHLSFILCRLLLVSELLNTIYIKSYSCAKKNVLVVKNELEWIIHFLIEKSFVFSFYHIWTSIPELFSFVYLFACTQH